MFVFMAVALWAAMGAVHGRCVGKFCGVGYLLVLCDDIARCSRTEAILESLRTTDVGWKVQTEKATEEESSESWAEQESPRGERARAGCAGGTSRAGFTRFACLFLVLVWQASDWLVARKSSIDYHDLQGAVLRVVRRLRKPPSGHQIRENLTTSTSGRISLHSALEASLDYGVELQILESAELVKSGGLAGYLVGESAKTKVLCITVRNVNKYVIPKFGDFICWISDG